MSHSNSNGDYRRATAFGRWAGRFRSVTDTRTDPQANLPRTRVADPVHYIPMGSDLFARL